MSDRQMMDSENSSLNKNESTASKKRLTPTVDIYETDAEMVLLADLPGVEEPGLQIEVTRGVLTLEAEQVAAKGKAGAAYFRQFKLSERIDADAGEATLKDGVLTLKLPKSEAAQPKRIAVKTLH